MASLEDKILGDAKRDNYCSDSDEETEIVKQPMKEPMKEAKAGKAMSHQTGVKGVLDDFTKANDLGELKLEVGGDAFLDLWRQKELKDLKKKKVKVKSPVSHQLIDLNQDTFSSSIDSNEPNTIMIIHVYGDNARCREVTKHLSSLSIYYPQVKFYQVDANNAGTVW